jgi:hypothetical protein
VKRRNQSSRPITSISAPARSPTRGNHRNLIRRATTTLLPAPTTFAVYDAFADEEDRRAHLEANGEALRAAGAELFAAPPTIEHVDVVASLLPGE